MTIEDIHKTSIVDPLDSYLGEVVTTLDAAVSQGMRNVRDHPDVTAKNIADCEEILSAIMQGHVSEWVN